jgi:hypothetical protein
VLKLRLNVHRLLWQAHSPDERLESRRPLESRPRQGVASHGATSPGWRGTACTCTSRCKHNAPGCSAWWSGTPFRFEALLNRTTGLFGRRHAIGASCTALSRSIACSAISNVARPAFLLMGRRRKAQTLDATPSRRL